MSHEQLEQLAAHILALRFGDGLRGLVAGQGLALCAQDLCGLYPGAITSDDRLLVDAALAARTRHAVALWLLAHHVLVERRRNPCEIPALALALGAPRAPIEQLRRQRWLLPASPRPARTRAHRG